MTHPHNTDQFAQPRDPANAIHLAIGEWEYRGETDAARIAELVKQGWRVVLDDGPRTLLKYTHWERIE